MARLKLRLRGLALLELAVVLPLVFLLICGVIEYGWLFYKQQQLTAAARGACRYAITQAATYDSTLARLDELMQASGFEPGSWQGTCTMGNAAGSPVAVQIRVQYDGSEADPGLELIGFPLIPVPEFLSGAMTMAKEGPP